jgi:hypothetical protein
LKPVVVIHTNDQQLIAARVSAHSLKSRSRSPDRFDVRLLRLEETPYLYKRDGQKFLGSEGVNPSVWRRRDSQSFAPLRRFVPQLLGFAGRALLIDPDVFAVGDVYELLSRDMNGKAILCRQRPPRPNGEPLGYSTAVMLLDCAQLRHWQWERDIDDLFSFKLMMMPWLSLQDESPARIGLFEEEWNHLDTLTQDTKLLHNTEIRTQPWKTGLPADYHQHAPPGPLSREGLKRGARRLFAKPADKQIFYLPHPDPRQERLFFGLLQECVDQGTVTERMLRAAIRKRYIRKDTFALLDALRHDSAASGKIRPMTTTGNGHVQPLTSFAASQSHSASNAKSAASWPPQQPQSMRASTLPIELLAGVAQTNLQLYNQLLAQGRPDDDLTSVYSAYKLASLLYSGHYQGDGKPFVCHGVGVASIAAILGLPTEFVAVALIHNIYGNGDFGDALRYTVTHRRRRLVKAAVGERIAWLAERFHSIRLNPRNIDIMNARLTQLDSVDRNLLIVDLADTLEKYVDLGVLYFGDGEWIKEAQQEFGLRLIELATRLDQPRLAQALRDAFSLAASNVVPDALRQAGQKYLELTVPLSCRRRRPVNRDGMRRGWYELLSRLPGAKPSVRRMVEVAGCTFDVDAGYSIGGEIDFGDALASRRFLGEGWYETESWGVWSRGGQAKLYFSFGSPRHAPLVMRILAHGFIRPANPVLRVGVWMGDRSLATWTFDYADTGAREARWMEAAVPGLGYRALALTLALDSPASPAALGESDDRRQLGLGLHKLVIEEARTG